MDFLRQTGVSNIYHSFRQIEVAAYPSVVYFYETQQKYISQLSTDEYFEITTVYTDALLQLGRYEKLLPIADEMLEISIMENIKYLNGVDIFPEILLQKATALFRLHRHAEALHVFPQLLRMKPNDLQIVKLAEKCLTAHHPATLQTARAWAMFLFLAAAAVAGLGVLIIYPFFEDYGDATELGSSILFGLGWVSILLGELFQRKKIKNKILSWKK